MKKINNIVAKYCCRFNRAKVEEDKSKQYKRKEKHCKKAIDYSYTLQSLSV
jgi:hypothetical protein